MMRREFITLFGGAAAWPLAARAQQAERVRRIGMLMAMTADNPESAPRLAAFAQGLQQSGWTIGQNVRVDYRWSGGNADSMRKHAAEIGRSLSRRHPGPFERGRRAVATGDPNHSDRVHGCHGPGRRRLRR